MEYYLNLLVDPVEIDASLNNASGSFADKYRPYLFNIPNLCISKSIKDMAKLTNTNKKYWTKNFDIIDSFVKLLNKYRFLPKHNFVKYLDGDINLPTEIKEYYHKIYNIADIIIYKSIYMNQTESGKSQVIQAINICFDNAQPSLHIAYRMIFYFSVYLLKYHLRDKKESAQKLKNTFINKINEFKNSSNINEYFATDELQYYELYINKLNDS